MGAGARAQDKEAHYCCLLVTSRWSAVSARALAKHRISGRSNPLLPRELAPAGGRASCVLSKTDGSERNSRSIRRLERHAIDVHQAATSRLIAAARRSAPQMLKDAVGSP